MKKLSLFAVIVAFLASCGASEFDGPSVPQEEKTAKVVITKEAYINAGEPLSVNYEGRRVIVFVVVGDKQYSATEVIASAEDMTVELAVPQDASTYQVYVYMPDDENWQPRDFIDSEEDDDGEVTYYAGVMNIESGFIAVATAVTNSEATFYIKSFASSDATTFEELEGGEIPEAVTFDFDVDTEGQENGVIVLNVFGDEGSVIDNITETDDVKVTYMLDGETIVAFDRPPFIYDLIIADKEPGIYVLTAMVENSLGHMGKKTESFTIEAKNAANAPTIMDWTGGGSDLSNSSVLTGGTVDYKITVNVSVNDPQEENITISKVEFYIDGAIQGTADAVDPDLGGNTYSVMWNIPDEDKFVTITAKATDSNGSVSERTLRVEIKKSVPAQGL